MSSERRDELADHFATLLRVDRGRIETAANVLELGADSIMLLEARTWIEARYGHRIEIRRFFEDLTTIDAIAAFLVEAGEGAPRAAAAPQRDASDAVDAGALRTVAVPADAASADIRLMRSQLALVAEVIEAQNRVAARLRRRAVASDTAAPTASDDADGSSEPVQGPGVALAGHDMTGVVAA